MTRIPLAILFALPLTIVGCGDGSNGNGGDPDCTGADCGDDDTGPGPDDGFEATIVATTPFEGVAVSVAVRNSGDWELVECTGTTCTFEVPEADEYSVAAEDTYTFISKQVDIEDPGEFQVSWVTGGCASDPEWDAASECSEWVPGEYGMVTFDGERNCVDEIWGREAEIEFIVSDEAITITGISSSYESTMSGNTFYGSHSSGNWYSGDIAEDGTFNVYMTNAASGDVSEFLFNCD